MILDFHTPFAYQNHYIHNSEIRSYKMNYSRLFSWNPIYTLIVQSIFSIRESSSVDDVDSRLSVVLLRKNIAIAYPQNPFINKE